MRTITHQEIAEDRNQNHQRPRRDGNAVPPGGLGVPLRVQDVVHASEDQRTYSGWLSIGGTGNCGPQLSLQLSALVVDLTELVLVARVVFADALTEVAR